ncbi:MAG: DUF502 domain-containing protein [Planctomycetes bacterium]|nr:DUF502 domain-containing protein [Planctomycetota bacterium]
MTEETTNPSANPGNPEGKKKGFRNPFITGLIALLPTLITIFVLVIALRFFINNFGRPIGQGILYVVKWMGWINKGQLTDLSGDVWVTSILGFPLMILVVFLVGYFMTSVVGRKVFRLLEQWLLNKFPVVKNVYPHAKQFTQVFLADSNQKKFKRVVALEYPRLGLYSLGFVTSDGMKDINAAAKKNCISVFVPSSPAPVTGYTIFLSPEDTIPLNVSVDEAFRVLISGGVLIPPHQLTSWRTADISGRGDDAEVLT